MRVRVEIGVMGPVRGRKVPVNDVGAMVIDRAHDGLAVRAVHKRLAHPNVPKNRVG